MAATRFSRSDKRTIHIEEEQAENLPLLTIKIQNNASGQVEYVGEAYPGTSTSEARWRIKKIEYNGENPSSVSWADGTSRFTKIWDNRASYSYS